MRDSQLRIKVGPNVHSDFEIKLGDLDLTKHLLVESLSMDADANAGRVKVTMVVYADSLEVLPDDLQLLAKPWPPKLSLINKIRGWWKGE